MVPDPVGLTVGELRALIQAKALKRGDTVIEELHIKTVNCRRDLVYMEPDPRRLDVAVTSPTYHPTYMTPDTDIVERVYEED